MTYPKMTDYQIAVQHPDRFLFDSDLRVSNVESTPNHLPKARSGGFAVTYKLNNGGNSWAVRCFHKETPDLESRYERISQFLRSNSIPHFVDFSYQPEGILVNGSRWPIVKMAWIGGQTLETYIETHLQDRLRLGRIASELRDVIAILERLGAAHGDLSHGNILADDTKITLIDYDGMFVPALQGTNATELGHVNYQSPLRNGSDFGPGIDRFSGIVISLAIEALQHDPELWARYSVGDNLLFRKQDFVQPNHSQLFDDLRKLPNLSHKIDQFALLCSTPMSQLPTLDDFLSESVKVQASQAVTIPAAARVRLHQHDVVEALERQALLSRVGEVVQVVGKITNVKISWGANRQRYAFVDFGDWKMKHFRLTVWSPTLMQFHTSGIDLNSYEGQWVTVIGLIQEYRGTPQIVIDDSREIRVLRDGENDARQLISEGRGEFPRLTQSIPPKASHSRNAEVVKRLGQERASTPSSSQNIPTAAPSQLGSTTQSSTSRNQQALDRLKRVQPQQTPPSTPPQSQVSSNIAPVQVSQLARPSKIVSYFNMAKIKWLLMVGIVAVGVILIWFL